MLLSLPIITNCSFYLSLFFLHPKPFSIFFLFAQLPPPYAPNLFSLQLALSFLLHLFCQIVVVSYLFISFFYTMKLCFHCVMGWETQRNCTFIFILFFCKITQQKHDFVVFLVEKNNIIIFPLWNDFFNILFALYYNMQMQRNISNDLWLHQHVMMQSWLNDNSNLRKQR